MNEHDGYPLILCPRVYFGQVSLEFRGLFVSSISYFVLMSTVGHCFSVVPADGVDIGSGHSRRPLGGWDAGNMWEEKMSNNMEESLKTGNF